MLCDIKWCDIKWCDIKWCDIKCHIRKVMIDCYYVDIIDFKIFGL